MLLRSHSQEGHGVGCQCGCSSKVIHYSQVAKTVAPTSESCASEALERLEQSLNGHNCHSERFYDAEGLDSRVDGQKHAEGDYRASEVSGNDSAGCHREELTRQFEYDGNCHCVACYLDSKKEEQEKSKTEAELRAEEKAEELAVEQAIFRAGLQAKKYARKLAKKDAKLGGETKSQKKATSTVKPIRDSLDNSTVSKASTNFLRPDGDEFEKFIKGDKFFQILLKWQRKRQKEEERMSKALVGQGATYKQVAAYKSCAKWTLYGLHKQEERAKLFGVNRCGNHKCCPICAAIKARKDARVVYAKVTQALAENPHLALSMLTLTIPKQEDLEEAYRIIDEALKKLNAHIRRVHSNSSRDKSTLGSIEGSFRAIEVTRKTHVHAHILILHSKFINMAEVQRLWCKWTSQADGGKSKRRVVDISNVCKPYEFADGGDDARYRIRKAVIECAKYTCKMASMNEEYRSSWWRITHCKRLHMFTGCLRAMKLPEQQAEQIDIEEWELYVGRYDSEAKKYHFEHVADLSDEEQAIVSRVFEYGWIPNQILKKPVESKIETITVFRGGNVEKIHRPITKVGITECRK